MPCNSQKPTLSLVQKRILIADDHLAVREGLRSLIDPDPDFKVVGEAADGNEAARKALELRPDVIMLDNSMPGMTGLEVARMLRDNLPATKIVFLTLDPGIRDLALATGALAQDLGLGRIRTLSPEGHELAAQRWYDHAKPTLNRVVGVILIVLGLALALTP